MSEIQTKQAMDRCRDGATITIDHPNGTVSIEAERDGTFASYTATLNGETSDVEGISVRKALVRHDYRVD